MYVMEVETKKKTSKCEKVNDLMNFSSLIFSGCRIWFGDVIKEE